ncbi:MAG: polyprenyl synthetase family protein [Candidatus Helarchaeota archaeon]|nr:polyprenyl synthetase family protein [Candidatus Helarchaeota archaeon]
MNLLESLNKKAALINREIRQLIPTWELPDPINEAINHILESGGKRIRPILALLSCESVGGDINSVMKQAIALELIHNASLLWDDVLDADELRRGKITVHKKWDKNIAILAGAMITSKALELISNKPEILDLYLKVIGKMIEGQVLDISNSIDRASHLFESKSEKEIFEILRKRFQQKALEGMDWEESGDSHLIADFTEFEEERDYFEMITYKTSSLIKLATRIGATLGGGTQEEIDALTDYGLYLGLAFQLRDDLIGIISDEKTLGKPVGSDIRQGKLNLYTIFALRNLENSELSEFLELMRKADNKTEIQRVRKILDDCGALKYAKDKLKSIAQKAQDQLSTLRDTAPKITLNKLILFTIEREF